MTITSSAPECPPARAASALMRIIPSMLLFAAIYGWAVRLGCIPFHGLHAALGGTCAALLPLILTRGKAGAAVEAALIAALAAVLALVPSMRAGAALACNALFTASEAANRYAYIRFTLPPQADPAACGIAFGCWLAWAAGVVAGGAAGSRSAAVPLLAAVGLAAAQVYLGLVPSTSMQLLLFGCLGVLIIRDTACRASWPDLAAASALMLALALAVGFLMPGVHPELEARSEQLRDWLSSHWPGGASVTIFEDISTNSMRQESLLTGAAAGKTQQDQAARSYEHQQKYQRDISDPRPVNYLKTILMLLLVLLTLIGPFLPFLWLDRQRRRAAAMREAFDAEDPAQAIAAMFRQVTRLMIACGARPDNRGLSMPDAQLPAAYRFAYRRGITLFQEAVYSDHPMTGEQKAQMAALLRQAQQLVYERAGRRLRFRLQYVECLILPEELE